MQSTPVISKANMLSYVVHNAYFKNRVKWKLPAGYFETVSENVPRMNPRKRKQAVSFLMTETHLKYWKRHGIYQSWSTVSPSLDLLTIRFLKDKCLELILEIAAQNKWYITSISSADDNFNYIPNSIRFKRIQHKWIYSIRFIVYLVSTLAGLYSFTKIVATYHEYQNFHIGNSASKPIMVSNASVNSLESSNTSHYSLKEAKALELLDAVLECCKTFPQANLKSFTFAPNMQQVIHTDHKIKVTRNQVLSSQDVYTLCLEGIWEIQTDLSDPIEAQIELFDTLIETIRSLKSVQKIECIRFSKISDSSIDFSIQIL